MPTRPCLAPTGPVPAVKVVHLVPLLAALLVLLAGVLVPSTDGRGAVVHDAVETSRSVEPGPATLSAGIAAPSAAAERRAADGQSSALAPVSDRPSGATFPRRAAASQGYAGHRSAALPLYHLHRALLI